MTDHDLLEKYVNEGSREALGTLMQRHVGMVHAAALREVRNASMAEDVTQAVFLVLMHRAASISHRVYIGGWLFKVTRYAASNARRGEARRAHHEREASKMINAQTLQTHRAEIEPVLNEAVAALRKADRELVVMRYLQGQSMREIAQAQHVTENALRQRLMRALQRLRKRLAKCGVTGSTDAVAAVLESSVLPAGPPNVVDKVSATILGTRAPHESSEAIAKGVVRMIKNMKLATFAGAALVSLVFLIGAFEGLKTVLADGTNIAAPTTAPAPSEIANTPAQALRAAYQTAMSGDADALVAACTGLTDQQAQTLRQLAPAMKAMNELEQAIADTYGVNARAQFEKSMIGVNPADLDKATEQINGDQAVVDIGRSGPG